MSEMVERVARALALSAGGRMAGPGQSIATREFGWKSDGESLDRYVEAHWKEHVHAADFAIEAMVVPTEAMLEAGPGEPYMDRDVWAKMIRAANESET